MYLLLFFPQIKEDSLHLTSISEELKCHVELQKAPESGLEDEQT